MSDRRITRGIDGRRGLHTKFVITAALWAALLVGPAPAQDRPQPPEYDRSDRRADVEAAMRQRRADALTADGSQDEAQSQPQPRPGGFGPDQREPSEAEFQAAADAMRTHAPNWWRRFDNAPPGAPHRRRMMRAVVERYRELQRIEQRDPEQHSREIKQLELEDEILGLAPRIWRDREGSVGDVEVMKSQLRKIAELVDLRIRNREARLERLTETLNAEKRKLEADKQARDKTVAQRYEAVFDRKLEPVFPGGGPGRPGRAPRGAGGGGGPDGGAILGPPPSPDPGPPPGRGPGPEPRGREYREGRDDDRPRPPLPPPPLPPPPSGEPQD